MAKAQPKKVTTTKPTAMKSTTRRPGLHLAEASLENAAQPRQTRSQSRNNTPEPSSAVTAASSVPAVGVMSTILATIPEVNESEDECDTPIITPGVRQIALKMIDRGTEPSALGTILPSLHPGHLRALFLGSMSDVAQFLATSKNQDNPYDNDAVVYFNEWSVDHVLRQAVTKQRDSTANDRLLHMLTQDELIIYDESVRLVQGRVSRDLEQLQVKVHNWNECDTAIARREKDALEAIINDPITERPGALENMETYWRSKLGWVGTSAGYWFDSAPAALTGMRLKFIAFGPGIEKSTTKEDAIGDNVAAVGDVGTQRTDNKIKYFWSEFSGAWKTEEGIKSEQSMIKKDRNAWLVKQIGRIEREREDDLVMERVGFVSQFLQGGLQHERLTVAEEWTGVKGLPGQKATKRRRVRKQTPTRSFGSVEFVPEDGGLTMLEKLAEAAEVERLNLEAEKEVKSAENGLKKAIEDGSHAEEIPASREQAEKEAEEATTATNNIGKTNKRKRNDENDENDEPITSEPFKTAGTTWTVVKPTLPPPPKPKARSQSPQKKKRKTKPAPPKPKPKPKAPKVKAEEPVITGARKSTRIAKKRKLDDIEEAIPPTTNEADEDTAQPDPSESRRKRQKTVKSAKPAAETLENESSDDQASSDKEPAQQITPHRPISTTYQSLTTSPLSPMTATIRTSLEQTYPFLQSIPETSEPDTASSRDEWLAFLHHFGRNTGIEGSLNAFFALDGALNRGSEFLRVLKGKVGRIRRVGDVDGERRYVFVD